MPEESGSKYERIIREVVSGIQVLIYRRETAPIRDREEVRHDLNLRITNINGCGRQEWRKRMVELAAYALYAAVSDESHG